jgi:hypothetical protein
VFADIGFPASTVDPIQQATKPTLLCSISDSLTWVIRHPTCPGTNKHILKPLGGPLFDMGTVFSPPFRASVNTRGMDRVLGCWAVSEVSGWVDTLEVTMGKWHYDVRNHMSFGLSCRAHDTPTLLEEEGKTSSGVSGRTFLDRIKEHGDMVALRDGG